MTLLCPRTQTPLKEIIIDGVKVDISEKSGGVWFDNFEIKKFDELHEQSGDRLLEILSQYSPDPIDHETRIKCPKCRDVVMMRSYYSPKRQVELDTCPMCAGVWLDPGELSRIREMFTNEVEKKSYVKHFVNEMCDENLGSLAKFVVPSVLIDQKTKEKL